MTTITISIAKLALFFVVSTAVQFWAGVAVGKAMSNEQRQQFIQEIRTALPHLSETSPQMPLLSAAATPELCQRV